MLLCLASIEAKEDKSKFEKLYSAHRQTMFYVANRILRDEYLSEDAVHQAFMKVMNHLDKIEEISSHRTRGFLVIIVENVAFDLYRKRKRENVIPLDEIELYTEDAENQYLSSENRIEEAMLRLPANYLSVMKLKYSQGYNDKEIAELLDISQVNVRKRIERGRKKLRALLTEMGVDME